MSHIGIVLTGAPWDSERWYTAYRIGKEALNADHQVTYFHYLDGIYTPIQDQTLTETSDTGMHSKMPHERFSELMDKGAEILICGICVEARGIAPDKMYPDEVTIGLLPDLADMIGATDRVISL